jgi:hypothetical protein
MERKQTSVRGSITTNNPQEHQGKTNTNMTHTRFSEPLPVTTFISSPHQTDALNCRVFVANLSYDVDRYVRKLKTN